MELKPRQRLGKYRVVRKLAVGGFAIVYEALDTVEGIRVALKLPRTELVDKACMATFKQEVRLLASLDHPNIQPLKTADTIDGQFVLVHPLAAETLADRLRRRLSTDQALDFAGQLLAGLAHAHQQHVVHCDVKPENLLLFSGKRLRLTDFGISKVAHRTLMASGSGTLGYVSPEQAMGRPSMRSDVFSAGLVLLRMFGGSLPAWPFHWPPPGHERLRRKLAPAVIEVLRRSIEVDGAHRFRDAVQMLQAFQRARARGSRPRRKSTEATRPDWKRVRRQAFLRGAGRGLGPWHDCGACGEPVSESMRACPWCGKARPKHSGETRSPASCPRCKRGVKLDWTWCAWCWGGKIGPLEERRYSDRRYEGSCQSCREPLLPFMAYCPWCHAKVKRVWPLPAGGDACPHCRCGVASEAWSTCPWCKKSLGKRRG